MGELANIVQNGSANRLGVRRRFGLKPFLYAFQPEFLIVVLVVFALTLDDAPRNQQKDRSFLQSHCGSVAGGVSEQTKRQARGCEFDNAGIVTEQSWRMPGVGVAESAEFFVVTGDECGTRVHPCGGFHEASVEVKTERNHSFGFVDVRSRKKFSPKRAKDILCGREDDPIILPTAGNIKQAKQDPFWTNR